MTGWLIGGIVVFLPLALWLSYRKGYGAGRSAEGVVKGVLDDMQKAKEARDGLSDPAERERVLRESTRE